MRLTRSVRDRLTGVTMGGAPAYVWPGGGITVMAPGGVFNSYSRNGRSS